MPPVPASEVADEAWAPEIEAAEVAEVAPSPPPEPERPAGVAVVNRGNALVWPDLELVRGRSVLAPEVWQRISATADVQRFRAAGLLTVEGE